MSRDAVVYTVSPSDHLLNNIIVQCQLYLFNVGSIFKWIYGACLFSM